jgi:hypothetical protein
VALGVAVWLAFFRAGPSAGAGGGVAGRPAAGVDDAASAVASDEDPALAAAAPAAAPAPPVAAASNVQHAETVRFEVDVAPASAKIYLDGVHVPGNPVALRFRKDGIARSLRIAAPGSVDRTMILGFDRDIVVKGHLERLAAPAPAPLAADAGPATPALAGQPRDAGRPRRDAGAVPASPELSGTVVDRDAGPSDRGTVAQPPPSAPPPGAADAGRSGQGAATGFREVTLDAGRAGAEASGRSIENANPYRRD